MGYQIVSTDIFTKWHKSIKDLQAFKTIAQRLLRAEVGNLGDIKSVGDDVSGMRIFVGKGYRLYFTIRANKIVILLCGGTKDTQSKDIKKAKEILKNLE